MPRGRLREKLVQTVAIEWLACHYYPTQPEVKKVVTFEQEVSLNHGPKQVRGRADGLLVAVLDDHRILTVSMEAKSSRLLKQLLHADDGNGPLVLAIALAFVMMIAVFVFGWNYDSWFVSWLLAPVIGAVFFIGYMIAIGASPIPAVSQISRYPGDERWLALSTDSFNSLFEVEIERLKSVCNEVGIGILTVSSRKNVNLVQQATRREANTTRNFSHGILDCYSGRKAKAMKLAVKLELSNIAH